MSLVISLLVYNQLEVTKNCIKSLLENTTGDYLLVVSDNASNKETEDYLRSLQDNPKIVYIRNEENLGFIKAHNNVFDKYNYSKYFCVLNNDIIVKTKGWNYKLVAALTYNVAQVGPAQEFGHLNEDGLGGPRANEGTPLDYISGHCFVVKTENVIEAGGLFEDTYMKFAFCEDSDLSLRLRNKGYLIHEVPNVEVQHLHNVSFKNEKVDIDFVLQEQLNKNFLRARWQKYFTSRNFNPSRILIKRTGALGDVLATEPTVRALKLKYPCSELYFETVCPDALRNHPELVEVGRDLTNKYLWNSIIELDQVYERKPLKHFVDAYAEYAEVILTDKVPRVYGIAPKEKLKGTITVCSEGSWASRTWDRTRWYDFIRHLSKTYRIIEVGTSGYLGIGDNLVGKLTLPETVSLIQQSELYVGFDGGLMHFAQAVGTPIFIIFGCTSPAYRIHDWSKARVVWLNQDELDCAGCHHLRDAPRGFTQCDRDKTYCLDLITTDLVIWEFENGNYEEPKGVLNVRN